MVIRFLDLQVYSSSSIGKDAKDDLESRARTLGLELRFCDGISPACGKMLSFKKRSDLKNLSEAVYLILEPLSKEALAAVEGLKNVLISTTLTPALSKTLKKNNSSVLISLSSLIGSTGIRRIRFISAIKTNLKFSRKYGVSIVVSSGAKSIYDLRSPHQVLALLKVLGFTETEATNAMYIAPKRIIDYGTEKIEKKVLMDGVRVL